MAQRYKKIRNDNIFISPMMWRGIMKLSRLYELSSRARLTSLLICHSEPERRGISIVDNLLIF